MQDDEATVSPMPHGDALFGDVASLIDGARTRATAAVNSELVMLYWRVGKRVREDVLGGERAAYGADVVKRLATRLTERYGRGWSKSNLLRMIQFAAAFGATPIVATLSRQLSWSHFVAIIALADARERDFYAASAARERWSVRTLRERVASKLYERTLAAPGSADGLEADAAALAAGDTPEPSLLFRDPYVLDFLGLPAKHSEADLERAILDEIQRFLLELGDYGQMMLYLRWLDAHQHHADGSAPIGIILCTEKGPEQVALLGLDSGEVRAAQYVVDSVRAGLEGVVARAKVLEGGET